MDLLLLLAQNDQPSAAGIIALVMLVLFLVKVTDLKSQLVATLAGGASPPPAPPPAR